MKKVSFDDYKKALDEAGKVFGVDPGYYGKEGEEEVDRQLLKMGYTEEELRESKTKSE